MLPADALWLLAIVSALLIILRYADLWLFFRANGTWLRQLQAVPWMLRSKVPRPSPYIVMRGHILMIKLATMLVMTPLIVSITALIRPEWITALDVVAAGLSTAMLLAIMWLEGRLITLLCAHYDIPISWQALLR